MARARVDDGPMTDDSSIGAVVVAQSDGRAGGTRPLFGPSTFRPQAGR